MITPPRGRGAKALDCSEVNVPGAVSPQPALELCRDWQDFGTPAVSSLACRARSPRTAS